MKAFVITLMDNPQSVEVAQRCVESGRRNGIDIWNYEAFSPKDDPVSLLQTRGIDPIQFDERYSRNLNCISAFLSHYGLWEQCVKSNETFVIFEHDAVLFAPVPTAPFNYVMNIGAPSYGKHITPAQIGVNPLTSKRYFPGAHAYMVTPAGAKLLIENAPMYAKPTDVYLNLDTFPWLQEYFPFCAEARDSFTTIQVEQGCLAKHNWKEGYGIIDA
jgi:GR25 family glycosyltransferase involved in LPS biosynthesis|tara:strand:- start:539 stop:1186 length:648 start_codon:yes stop_codon:yes gene_type:complete